MIHHSQQCNCTDAHTLQGPTGVRRFKHLQPDYYGWRDEEDALLLLQEQQMEQCADERAYFSM